MVSFTAATLIAASLNLFASGAYAAPDVLEGEINTRDLGNSTLLKRSADCDLAQYFFADIDCYYDWDGGNNLNYVVKIEPNGQANDNEGWCKGIISNMIGECGRNPSDNRAIGSSDYKHCNDYLTANIHNPVTKQVVTAKGIDLNFWWNWPWSTNDDQTACITTAIQKATCAGDFSFKNGKCYKRNG